MDQKIFNRSYLLSVVEKRDSGIVAAQPDIPDYEVEGFTTEPTYGRYNQFYEFTITDLQIVAEIDNSSTTKKAGASVNQIIIYNLDEDTRSKVCKEGNYVILRAGYGYGNKQDLPIIFSGQVQRATSQKQNSDYVSVLLCKEGYDSMKYIRISKSMKSVDKDLTYQDIVSYLISVWKDNGIPTSKYSTYFGDGTISKLNNKYKSDDPSKKKLGGGWSFSGYLTDAMDDICFALDYVWHIAGGILYIHPKEIPEIKTLTKLKPEHIKDIRYSEDGSKSTTTGSSLKLVTLSTFLDPTLSVNEYIEVKGLSKEWDNTYLISGLKHVLDYRGRDWTTMIECKVVLDE